MGQSHPTRFDKETGQYHVEAASRNLMKAEEDYLSDLTFQTWKDEKGRLWLDGSHKQIAMLFTSTLKGRNVEGECICFFRGENYSF